MIGRVHSLRANIVLGFFVFFALSILLRLGALQLRGHRDFSEQARRNRAYGVEIPPRRGEIVDRRGNVLATSEEVQSLYAVPDEISDPGRLAARLAPVLALEESFVESRLRGPGRFRWVKRHLDGTEVEAVRALGLEGIGFRAEMKRIYPKGRLLTQALGLTDLDGRGLDGLELQFDRQLRGRPGWRLSELDGRRARRELIWHRRHDIEPVDGSALVLTIDEVVQDIAEEELDRVFREYRAGWATLIVMEIGTGDILALANRPTLDPNFSRLPEDHRRNRAVTDTFEPGSTFKIFPAAVALEKGVVDLDTEIYCEEGFYRGPGFTLRDHRPFGDLTFLEVITRSSNIGMAKVGLKIGEQELYRRLSAFSLGEKTGVHLPGEAPGLLRSPREWSRLSLSRITMGHEVSVTPLGLLTAFAALGNDGRIVRPRIVDRIESPDGVELYRFPRQQAGQPVSPAIARRMRYLLARVTEDGGTGRRAAVPGLQVAGKTGTSQKYPLSERKHIASFVGMFPASAPRFAILVVVDEPGPEYYGGVVAAPVFRRVAERMVGQLEIHQPLGLVTRETEETASTAPRM